MNLQELKKILLKSWTEETSYSPDEWNASNPSLGQCAVTALMVDDYFGGDILWSEAVLPDGKRVSHYFNSIDGEEIDLTRSQFPKDTQMCEGVVRSEGFATAREYMLSRDDTRKRYELLKERVRHYLSDS